MDRRADINNHIDNRSSASSSRREHGTRKRKPSTAVLMLRRFLLSCILVAICFFLLSLLKSPSIFSQISGKYSFDRDKITAIGDLGAEAPILRAKAAGLYSLDLDQLVYGKNEDKKLSPYSITKILTCYLVLENEDIDLSDTVVASEKATQVYEDGSSINLKQGEVMSIEDLIYGTLLASGNDAAYALGEAVGGSEEGFAELMNSKLEEWGCTNTHFVNANGWKHKNHYTTARDMCIIAKKCFENETLRKMSAEATYTIPATNMSEARELKNYMKFVTKKVDGITAGKTGSWDAEDCSIVLEFRRSGLEAVLVLLGDSKEKRSVDAQALMKFAAKVTPGFMVSSEGDEVATVWVHRGARTRLSVASTGGIATYPQRNKKNDVEVKVETGKLEAPVKKGDVVGKYIVYVDDEKIGSKDIVAMENVPKGWLLSGIYVSNMETVVMACFVIVLVTLLSLLAAVHNMRKRRRRP